MQIPLPARAANLLACAVLPAGASLAPPALAAQAPDTSAYATGWADFTRYEAPTMCVAAATKAAEVARRTLAAQRAHRTPPGTSGHDTLPPPRVAGVARACGRRFTTANVPAPELQSLFQLALLAQDDAAARAALDRLLAQVPSDSARAARLVGAVNEYLAAEPVRLEAAESLLPRFGALGQIGRAAQADAYAALLRYHATNGDFAHAAAVGEEIVAFVRTLAPAELAQRQPRAALALAHRARLVSAWLAASDSSAATAATLAAAQAAQGELRALPAMPNPSQDWVSYLRLAQGPPEQLVTSLVPIVRGPFLGRQALPLPADYWFPDNQPPGPKPGVATLILGATLPYSTYDLAATRAEDIRRWHARYGDALRIVVVAPMTGYPLRTGGHTPASEAEVMRSFLLDDLKLPVTLGVWTGAAYAPPLPEPDGRVMPPGQSAGAASAPHTFADSLAGCYPGTPGWCQVALLGPDGRVLYTARDTPPDALNWPIFEAILDRTLTGVAPRAANPARP